LLSPNQNPKYSDFNCKIGAFSFFFRIKIYEIRILMLFIALHQVSRRRYFADDKYSSLLRNLGAGHYVVTDTDKEKTAR
jgi:hypothetical protein